MKSGTTYLQGALYKNKALLAERGFLVPGARWRQQIEAVLDVKGRRTHPEGDSVTGAWDRLVAEVDDWDGTALISVELLAPATPEAVEAAAVFLHHAPDFAAVELFAKLAFEFGIHRCPLPLFDSGRA